jgi:hypothetical protein
MGEPPDSGGLGLRSAEELAEPAQERAGGGALGLFSLCGLGGGRRALAAGDAREKRGGGAS